MDKIDTKIKDDYFTVVCNECAIKALKIRSMYGIHQNLM
jgi:hypothetical protein